MICDTFTTRHMEAPPENRMRFGITGDIIQYRTAMDRISDIWGGVLPSRSKRTVFIFGRTIVYLGHAALLPLAISTEV